MTSTEKTPEKAPEPKHPTAEERTEACRKEIAAVLERHSCTLDVSLSYEGVGNGFGKALIVGTTIIVPRQEQRPER